MNLFAIDEEIINCFDDETGEIVDKDKLNELLQNKKDKRESIALFIKDLNYEADAIANEIKNLQARKKAKENKAEWLKNYLAEDLKGENFETAKVSAKFRKSKSVVIDRPDELIDFAIAHDASLIRIKLPEINKMAVKKKVGDLKQFAHLEERNNLTIK